ncbi:DUF1702 family protein [Saccharopolyspora sp. CA-218241]|uniref:DUF1702 family protein n=1 Tax=Saccharopolyspora sp. CA-218241 TaxID=3240027 RepID=UPI003D95A83B
MISQGDLTRPARIWCYQSVTPAVAVSVDCRCSAHHHLSAGGTQVSWGIRAVRSVERGRDAAGVGRIGLPLDLADFEKRRFRLDRPEWREVLEGHAAHFLHGFNIAVRQWRDPHSALGALPVEERGFAYEGAAMHAALRDVLTAGRAHARARLLAGPGQDYTHLIHVGCGWALVPLRVPLPVPIPPTPLLRWLALDGAGFAETYFGGLAALRRRCRAGSSLRWQSRVAGCGRALWFAESADVDGVAAVIAEAPAPARPHLWSGIGLASCYAGCADESALDGLRAASGPHAAHYGQGALFAIAARQRSGIVPEHTRRAAEHLFGADPTEAAGWTDEAAVGLVSSTDIAAYGEWKARLRRVAEQRR